MQFAVRVAPSLDDLHAVQVRPVGVLDGPQQEAGRRAFRWQNQVASHGHALAIADLGQVRTQRVIALVVPSTEKAQRDARAGGRIDLAPLQGGEDRVARVFGGPDRRVAGGSVNGLGHPAPRVGFVGAHLAPEVVFIRGGEARVGVRRADHPELVGVGPEFRGEAETGLERAANVGSLCQLLRRQFACHAFRSGEIAPRFVLGELIVGRKGPQGLAVALDLGHFDDRLDGRPDPGVVAGQRFAFVVDGSEHVATAEIAVVGNGDGIAAGLLPVALEVSPQVLRVRTVVRGKRPPRHGVFGRPRKHDVAVQHGGRTAAVLVADKGGEPAGIVVLLGDGDDAPPHVEPEVVVDSVVAPWGFGHTQRLVAVVVLIEALRPQDIGYRRRAGEHFEMALAIRRFQHVGIAGGETRRDAKVLGVIGHHEEV